MSKRSKRGCGKVLRGGDIVADRWGVILCAECDSKEDAPIMAVWTKGRLNEGVTIHCGQMKSEAKKVVADDPGHMDKLD